MEGKKTTLKPLPEVEEDGQRDEQGGYGQSMAHNCHVKEDVG